MGLKYLSNRSLFSILLLLFLRISFSAQTSFCNGNRVLGMGIANAQNDSANYPRSISFAKDSAGAQVINLLFTWNTLEASPNVYSSSLLQTANAYYPAQNLKISMNIAPINTNVLCVPSDLDTVPFNSLKMIHRFERLLDTVFANIPNLSLYCLNIGNESDVTLGTNSVAWNQYTIFYDSVLTFVRRNHPGLKLGTTLTWGGLTAPSTIVFGQSLNAGSDIVSLTYYPLNSDFTVKAPSTVPADFTSVVNAYPSTPVCFQECGYPTSSTCNSSDSLQNLFVYYVFSSWDYYDTKIPFISFFSLTDWSQKDVNSFANYYNLHDPVFLGYLSSLGMRTNPGNGTSKPAFEMLRYQSAIRSCVTGIEFPSQSMQTGFYPNPCKTSATFFFQEPGEHWIEVFDMCGKKWKSHLCIGQTELITLEDLSPGLYLVRISGSSDSPTLIQKLIKLDP